MSSNGTVGDVCIPLKNETHLWNATATTLSHHAGDLWNKTHHVRIEVLVSLTAVVLLLLPALGFQRRRRRNWFIQNGAFGAYTLSSVLVLYTLGSMQSSAVKSSMYPIWAGSLFVLFSCTDSITAYALADNTQYIRLLCQATLYYIYALLLVSTVGATLFTTKSAWERDEGWYIGGTIFLFATAVYKSSHRIHALRLASCSWNLNKMVADYMYQKRTEGEDIDPATMEGCHYLVDWPLSKSKLDAGTSYATQLTADDGDGVIDVAKVWRCNSIGPELKDACLSFSLFHLLRRRFFGFACHESKERAHEFVFKGLLLWKNEHGDTDYDRVFKVIEVELAFMYDFFFTKYAIVFYGSRMAATLWSLASVTGICSIAGYVITRIIVRIQSVQHNESDLVSTTTADIVITLLILACTALLELLQLFPYWTSIWSRVSFVCQYLRRGSCCMITMRLKGLLTKIGMYGTSNKHYWQHKLGQYSLIESINYNPNPSKEEGELVRVLMKTMVCMFRYIYLFDMVYIHPINHPARRVREKSGKPIELPTEVKKALVDSLKSTNGILKNGKSFLVSNGANHLLWAWKRDMHSDTSCSQRKEKNQTYLILTWHVATCYCEMATLKYGPFPNEGTRSNFHLDVATKLSKYCAYLVVSAPKLLPGHHYDTRRVFDAVAEEAIQLLQSSRDKYGAMRNLAESDGSIFRDGVKLGKELEAMPEATRWKVIADFWAEMMLYVAPSDNVKEHIEQLTQGGEFITHLWALLSHAGILERDQQNPSHPHQEIEEDSARHEGYAFNSSARRSMLAPGPLMGDFTLQAPSPPGPQAAPPPLPVLEMTTAYEHRIHVPEVSSSTQQALLEEV